MDPAKDPCTSHSPASDITLLPLTHSAFKETQVLLQLPASQIPRGSTHRPAADFASAQTFLLPHKTHAACAELPVDPTVTSTLMWKS